MTSIVTFTGKTFSLSEPNFDYEDIGQALSKLCRFNGHTSQFYSVAQHCILVSEIMERYVPTGNPIEGFLHDAHEAYISDVPAPLKSQLPGWKVFESRLEALFWNWVDPRIRPLATGTKQCKFADMVAMVVEASLFIKDAPFDHPDYAPFLAQLNTAETNLNVELYPEARVDWGSITHRIMTNLDQYQYLLETDPDVIFSLWHKKLVDLNI